MRFGIIFGTVLVVLTSVSAFADPVIYTVTTDSAYGDFNAVYFQDQPLTEIFTGDTSTIHADPTQSGVYRSASGTATITIGSLGTFTFTDPVSFIAVQNFAVPEAGLSDSTLTLLATENPLFANYTGTTSIGPLSGHISLDGYPVETSGGTLVLDHASSDTSTFTAVVETAVTPEPSSIALFGTGLLGIAGVIRKRFAQ